MPYYSTKTPAETEAVGEELGRQLHGGEIIAFTGGLGAGKTTFCKGLARGLGCTDTISSPTYAIANLYQGRVLFAHFDAYRISTEDDLEAAGFYDYLDQGAVIAIEWSENVIHFLPSPILRVALTTLPTGERKIEIDEVSAL